LFVLLIHNDEISSFWYGEQPVYGAVTDLRGQRQTQQQLQLSSHCDLPDFAFLLIICIATILKVVAVGAKLLKIFSFSRKLGVKGCFYVSFQKTRRVSVRFFWLVLSCMLLSGCDQFFGKSIADICKEYPQMCSDLNPDAWCRAEKSNIIKHRYQNFLTPSDDLKYKLLLNFEDYRECIGKASQIEHIKLREKTTGRVKGLLTAERQLQRLARDTEDSPDPRLVYYHWSRFGSEIHEKKFLEYRDAGLLETPELQVGLASLYIKNNLPLTVETLYHALELYPEQSEIDIEIFNSLVSIFVKQQKFEQAYTWGYVARKFDAETLDLPQIEVQVRQTSNNIDALKQLGEQYSDAIRDGNFNAQNVPGL